MTKENAARLLKALEAAGLGTAVLTDVDDLLAHEITVFSDRVRIDVQTRTPGLTFAEAWARRQTMTYESQTFFVVGPGQLIPVPVNLWQRVREKPPGESHT